MPDLFPVRFPDPYYLARRSPCGQEIRDVMPWRDAISYVSDGTRFGVEFRDGRVRWLLRPEGAVLRADCYRLDTSALPPGLTVPADADATVRAIWRSNAALLAAAW